MALEAGSGSVLTRALPVSSQPLDARARAGRGRLGGARNCSDSPRVRAERHERGGVEVLRLREVAALVP
eukprot:6440102-Pyramimonas_sp.AAC.1